MKRISMSILVLCLLVGTVSAGDIPTGGIAPPPPPPDGVQSTTAAPGEIPTSGSSVANDELVMDLVNAILYLIGA